MQPDTHDIEPNAILTGYEILPAGAVRDMVTQTLLRNSLPDLNGKSKRFIPRSALFKIFGPQQVKHLIEILLPVTDRTDLEDLVKYICPEESQCSQCESKSCTGGRVLFATLIWIARQDLIPELLQSPGLCDSHLLSNNSGRSDNETAWRSDLLQKIEEPVEAELFNHVQLQLRAPFLNSIGPEDTEAFAFEDAVTLPWTGFTPIREPTPGNPCEVGSVHIHPAHHALDQHLDDVFALKIFQDNTRQTGHKAKAFEQEFSANQKLPEHDRLTPLLTAFRHPPHYYLVFPWAHGGNLKEFWESHTVDRQYSVDWVMRECLGLAEGLATLHGSPAAMLHADIKPTNILCFKVKGQETLSLRLADFGFSKQVGPGSKLASKDLRQIKTYRAPEQDIEQEVTLKSDIWSLGCVFLEFITWYLFGWSEIKAFSNRRLDDHDDPEATHAIGENYEDTFFTKEVQKRFWLGRFGLQVGTAVEALRMDEDSRFLARRAYSLRLTKSVQVGCRVKDTVTKHINSLGNHENCTQQLRIFLKFVQERVLVVDVEHRADSQAVRDFLQEQIPCENRTVSQNDDNDGTLGLEDPDISPDR